MEGGGRSVIPSACRRGAAGAVVLGVAAIHVFRVGAYLSGTQHRLYYSYASDLLLPLQDQIPGFRAMSLTTIDTDRR